MRDFTGGFCSGVVGVLDGFRSEVFGEFSSDLDEKRISSAVAHVLTGLGPTVSCCHLLKVGG